MPNKARLENGSAPAFFGVFTLTETQTDNQEDSNGSRFINIFLILIPRAFITARNEVGARLCFHRRV